MPIETLEPGFLRFRPRAKIIRTLGDRLISGPIAAVIELVKNAHDADAGYVRVTIRPSCDDGGRLAVEDNGHGMTFEDVQSKWMEPATTDKVIRKFSPAGRRLLGSKGIGRFAAARLGELMALETTAIEKISGKTQTTRIPKLEWNMFENIDYLADVKIVYEIIKNGLTDTGTRLDIWHLRDEWNRHALEVLHRELRRLVSPLEQKEKDFDIYLDLSAFTEEKNGFDGTAIVNGNSWDENNKLIEKNDQHRVKPIELHSACDYEVKGHFDPNGTFDGTMTIHRRDQKPEKLGPFTIGLKREFGEESCGRVSIHLFIFDREPEAVERTLRKAGMSGLDKREAKRILDEMVGVTIYRDHFRIRPYGESNQDWLELDKERVQDPAVKIGHNQVMGFVLISNEEESGLIERSSREGLEENGSYRRLVRLIRELFQRIEQRRRKFREMAGIGRRQRPEPFRKVVEIANMKWAEQLVSNLPIDKRDNVLDKIRSQEHKLREQLQLLEENYARLQARVTLGLILGEVLHEGRSPVALIQRQVRRLGGWIPSLCEESEEAYIRRTDKVPLILSEIEHASEKLRRLFRMLDPLSGKRRGKPYYFDAFSVVQDVAELFADQMRTMGIKVKINTEPGVPRVRGYKDDLTAALTNLVDNALYWLGYSNTAQPELQFMVSADSEGVVLDIIDNGPGVPEEFAEEIFDIGFTLKNDGTGLGLAIAREALERSMGGVQLLRTNPGTTFRIRLHNVEHTDG